MGMSVCNKGYVVTIEFLRNGNRQSAITTRVANNWEFWYLELYIVIVQINNPILII